MKIHTKQIAIPINHTVKKVDGNKTVSSNDFFLIKRQFEFKCNLRTTRGRGLSAINKKKKKT